MSARTPQSFRIASRDTVSLCLGARADSVERTAARELAGYLGRILRREVAVGRAGTRKRIRLGTPDSSAEIQRAAAAYGLETLKPDGFVVAPSGGGDDLLIMSKTGAGVLYGAYALLEALGVGFAPAGLDTVSERIPRRRTAAFQGALRSEPSFAERALMIGGWMKEAAAEQKAFYDTDVSRFLPIYTRTLDWMARYRLNSMVLALFWFGQAPAYRWFWSKDGERCDDAISGLILYRDYPALRWAEKYGEQIRRNQEMLRAIIRYAAERGIRVTLTISAEPAYPGGLCEAYPEFGRDGAEYIEHEAVWLRFQESRFRELFETFPDLGGYLYAMSKDCGNTPADIRGEGRTADGPELTDGRGDTIADEKLMRIARMNEAMLRGRDAAGSSAAIRFWEWAAFGVYPGDAGKMGRMKNRVSVARLDALLPRDIWIHMRMDAGEPTGGVNAFNPFLNQWPRHRRSAALHQLAEHHGLNIFPPVFWESPWKERAQFAHRCGVESLVLEAGYGPGNPDGTGLNLCDLDIHGFARLAWDKDADRDAVWREWAGIYFPGAPDRAADLLKPFHRIISAMTGCGGACGYNIPGRWNFRLPRDVREQDSPIDRLLRYNVAATREHARQMTAPLREAIGLLDEAQKKLEAMRDALGEPVYGRWKANLSTQRTLAELLETFVAATAWGSLLRRDPSNAEDRAVLSDAVRRMERLVSGYEHPCAPLYHRLAGWGWMSSDEWRRVFGALAGECRVRFGLDGPDRAGPGAARAP